MSLPSEVQHVACEQRTPEWWHWRLGRVTSSRVADIFKSGRKKGEESKARRDYRLQLVCEQITGRPAEDMDQWKGPWVERGKGREAEARAAYEARTASVVWTPGFLAHESEMLGASVDGAVGNFDRVLEIKVPKPAIHLEYLQANRIPDDYEHQVLMHFLLSGTRWVHFVSYCPDMPAPLQLLVIDQPRPADAVIFEFTRAIAEFLGEVSIERQKIERLMAERGAA